MLVRGTTPHGEERLARARRLRRSLYVLFGAFLLLVLLAIPLFISRLSQILPPDDPAHLSRVAKADAIWTFRPAPLAERLFGDAVVPLDLNIALSTLHQHGQVFVYHPTQPGGAPEWVVVMSRRRPQRVYDGALRRLFPLESELDLTLATHIDRNRLLIASDPQRLAIFREALRGAGPVPKVDVDIVMSDPELTWSYMARFRGPWGLLPARFTRAVTELTAYDPPPDIPIVVTCHRTTDIIAMTYPSDDPGHEFTIRKSITVGMIEMNFHHETGQPWIVMKGVSLTGEIEPGTLPPPTFDPDGPGRTW